MFPLYDLNPHRRFPWLTVLIILINVGILASQGLGPDLQTVYEFGFIPKRITDVGSGKDITVQIPAVNRLGQPVRGQPPETEELSTRPLDVYPTFITMMFLHGGWLHLLMNMWMLWIFGNNVEDRLGRGMFVCFYLLGGMVGSVCQWALDPNSTMPVIGASGAVAAVLGGYAITFPTAKVKTFIFPVIVDLPALVVLGVWFITEMVAGFGVLQGANEQPVAFWAHVGGFIAGMLLMPFLGLGASPDDADWNQEAREMFEFEAPRARVE